MTSGFVIRDGLENDIPACLELDHHYETDFVWQMSIAETPRQWQITFKTERLPRTLETEHKPNTERIRLALPPEQCFLVAASREGNEMLGYLTMRNDPVYRAALIQDVVVSQPYRRRRIATRLFSVARQWAKEHNLIQMTVECLTHNHPGIMFCQQAGFKFCGYNDQYYPNHDIAIFFSQTLR